MLPSDIDAVMNFLIIGVDEQWRHCETQNADHTPQLRTKRRRKRVRARSPDAANELTLQVNNDGRPSTALRALDVGVSESPIREADTSEVRSVHVLRKGPKHIRLGRRHDRRHDWDTTDE
jgi:hypothetical protein